MHIITRAITKSLEDENWFAALFMTLTLPSLCGQVEFDLLDEASNYIQWFDSYLSDRYKGLLSGKDCYLLHQACLYKQLSSKHYEVVQRFHFLLPNTRLQSHKTIVDGVLLLEIDQFCRDVTKAFEFWMQRLIENKKHQKKLEHLNKTALKLGAFE